MAKNPYFPNLFEPIQIGKVEIKNRVTMSAMGCTYRASSGEPTERSIHHYVQRAKGEVGLIILPTHGFIPGVGLRSLRFEEPHIDRDYELVEQVHSYGTKIALQLGHSGRQMRTNPASSSPFPCVLLGEEAYPTPRVLEPWEIYQIMDKFAEGAARAKRMGYDMIELHACHGYLFTSFMSPYMNNRTDEFGGSLENRMRFTLGVLKAIKKMVGDDFPIIFRFSADEFVEGGIDLRESTTIAQMVEAAGVAALSVSSGIYETLEKSNDVMALPEGWKLYIWEGIKQVVSIPTIACGGLKTPEFCEKIVAEGKADFVGLARPLLADPEWAKKAKEGRSQEIRRCISCNECNAGPYGGITGWKCSVNPFLGRHRDYEEAMRPATEKKRVMIIGGGAAGMEAAMIAASRGHQVTLYEQQRDLGGQLKLAAAPPGKEKMLWLRDYLASQIQKVKVKVELGTEVTPALIEKEKPDAVVVATGAAAIVPSIPGVQDKKVVTAHDLLAGKVEVANQRVVVVGGSMVGLETAHYLTERGNRVTIVEMLPTIASDMQRAERKYVLDQLREKQTVIITEREVVEVNERGVVIRDRSSGNRDTLEADRVVLAVGSRPLRGLADALNGKVPEVYAIGDSQRPRKVWDAVYEGAMVGRRI